MGCTSTVCPSTWISSTPGRTFVPGAVTLSPLTNTRPLAISSSAARREATPEWARNAWRRTSSTCWCLFCLGRGITKRELWVVARLAAREHHGQVFGARQVVQRAEAEVLQEKGRRSVQQRPAQPLAAAHHLHQAALLERLEHRAGAHAADVLQLGAAHRLAVGDDGQRLERGAREAVRGGHAVEALQHGRELGA